MSLIQPNYHYYNVDLLSYFNEYKNINIVQQKQVYKNPIEIDFSCLIHNGKHVLMIIRTNSIVDCNPQYSVSSYLIYWFI